MASIPVQILLGVYLGLLTGIIPGLVAWGLGFLFKYFTGVSIPAFAVIVFSLAIAGANGGLLALADPTIRAAPNSVTLTVAILVVLMMSIYAHAQGDKMGAGFPRRLSLRKLRDRTLSSDVVELVGGRGEVRITVVGEVGDVEGYPPMSPDLRAEIRGGEWMFPADLPLAELETRLADKLRTEFDLAEVTVRIDERGRAEVTAAPPTSGLSKRVPAGRRAVSIGALVPSGLARGDEVAVLVGGDRVEGTVVSAQSSSAPRAGTDGGEPEEEPAQPRMPTTTGGDGRVTVAVTRDGADRLLRADRGQVIVRSRGTRREFELLSLLRRAGKRFRKVTVGPESALAGSTIGGASIRNTYGVEVLAARGEGGWTVGPRGKTPIAAGDDLYVVGARERLDEFEGVAA